MAVPQYMTGNKKNHQGEGGGRPLKFKTVEELQRKIDEYFDFCDNRAIKKVDKDGNEYMITSPAPYTMSGLARALDVDRMTIVNYGHRDKFLIAVRAARARVEEDVESRMLETKNERGAQFSLTNNFGWSNKQEIDHTTKGEKLPTPIYGGKSTK